MKLVLFMALAQVPKTMANALDSQYLPIVLYLHVRGYQNKNCKISATFVSTIKDLGFILTIGAYWTINATSR